MSKRFSLDEAQRLIPEVERFLRTAIEARSNYQQAENAIQAMSERNMLQGGMAYSTTPQEGSPGSLLGGNQSVFPVAPAGVNGGGAQRQFVVNAAPPTEAVVGGDALFGTRGENVQVMTFSSTATDHAAVPAAGVVQKQLVPVPGPTTAPQPAQPAVPPKR